jgi:hypothetical protein
MLVGLAALTGAIGGCGAPQRETLQSRLASDIMEREPGTLKEAETEFARTKTALGLDLTPTVPSDSHQPGFSANGDPSQGIEIPPTPAQPSAPVALAPTSSGGNAGSKGESLRADADAERVQQCITPCRALRSMRQAVNAICRMTGASDSRCSSARVVLLQAVERTRNCACPVP